MSVRETFNPPSETMASESEPPLIRLGKVEKMGKHGGRQWMRRASRCRR